MSLLLFSHINDLVVELNLSTALCANVGIVFFLRVVTQDPKTVRTISI